MTSFAIPEAVWKQVKNLATERRVTAQSLWMQAMAKFLKRAKRRPV